MCRPAFASFLLLGLALFARPGPAGAAEKRLLWRIDSTGGEDVFEQIVLAGDKLLVTRAGVLRALNPATGEELWKYPPKGRAKQPSSQDFDYTNHFVLRVVNDVVVTALHEKLRDRKVGLTALSLADGVEQRRFVIGEDCPQLKERWAMRPRGPHAGKQLAFWTLRDNCRTSDILVIDLEEWREVARCEVPGLGGDVVVQDGVAYGTMRPRDAKYARAFALKVATGEMYSCAVRYGTRSLLLLPDGSALYPSGKLGPQRAYQHPWRLAHQAVRAGGGIYVRDRTGLYRAKPEDGSEIWRLDLGYWPVGRNSPTRRGVGRPAVGNGVIAYPEGTYLHVIEEADGKLRAAIRVDPEMYLKTGWSRMVPMVACDGERAFLSWPKALMAFSTHPVDPAKPDPADPADPAWTLARCRGALVGGDHEAALKAIWGVHRQVATRPKSGREVAGLLSQLSRSPAATSHPKLWDQILLSEGPVAGELFLDRFLARAPEMEAAAAAVLEVGTPTALRSAAALIPKVGKRAEGLPYLARAAARLGGGRLPAQQILSLGSVLDWAICNVFVDGPVEDRTFQMLLPRLRKYRPFPNSELMLHLTPAQVTAMLEGRTWDDKHVEGYFEAVKQQAESLKRGEGRKEQVKMVGPEPVKTPEVF
jgi:outer membrane protein assembly factor BamB